MRKRVRVYKMNRGMKSCNLCAHRPFHLTNVVKNTHANISTRVQELRNNPIMSTIKYNASSRDRCSQNVQIQACGTSECPSRLSIKLFATQKPFAKFTLVLTANHDIYSHYELQYSKLYTVYTYSVHKCYN